MDLDARPELNKERFNCPFCGAYTQQVWGALNMYSTINGNGGQELSSPVMRRQRASCLTVILPLGLPGLARMVHERVLLLHPSERLA